MILIVFVLGRYGNDDTTAKAAMAARRRVQLEAASDAAVRAETELEIEPESESSSEAAVDTESSTEEEDSIVSMADIGHGDEDAAGERQDDFDSLFGESAVPERADRGDEDVEGETEGDVLSLQEIAIVVYAEDGAEGERDAGLVSPVRESVVPERVDDEDERARSEPTSVDSDVPLLERTARSDAKGKGKAVGKDDEYVRLVRDSVVPGRVEDDDEDAEGDKDDGFVSPVHHSVVPEPIDHHDEDGHVSPFSDSAILERLDHHDEDATSQPTSLDSELPLLERRARREAKREAKGKGKAVYDDEHVNAIRDSIVPERVDHHDENEDATSETTSLNGEAPLLERVPRREAKGKQKAVSKDETSDLESMETPSEDISSTQVKNTRTPTKKASGKKRSKDRLSDTLETDEDGWVAVSSEYLVVDDVAGPSTAEEGGRRIRGRPRKEFKEPSNEDGMHEPPRTSRIVCGASPGRKTPRTTTGNPANMSSKKPRTAPATASKTKGNGSSSQKTVVVPEVAAAEAIWRDEAKKQTSETMRGIIAERWASGDMLEVLEKIMTNNAAKKTASSSSPSKPMRGVIAPGPESIQQEADTAKVFEAKARARREEVKKQRSDKLSASMKARWASGDMHEVLERRKANNAAKKASSSSPSKPRAIAPGPGSIQQEADTSEVAKEEAHAKREEAKKTSEKLAAGMKAIRAAGEMHEMRERKKAENAAKKAALATSSTSPVESNVQNDHQDAMEMEQQPLTASTEVRELVSRADTTFEDTTLEVTQLDEVGRITDDAEQGRASSTATAAKASTMPLPSADEIIAQGQKEIQKLHNMVAKKPGSSAAPSASHVSAAPATSSSVSSRAEPERLMRDRKNAECKAKGKAAAEAETHAEDKMDKPSTSSTRDQVETNATDFRGVPSSNAQDEIKTTAPPPPRDTGPVAFVLSRDNHAVHDLNSAPVRLPPQYTGPWQYVLNRDNRTVYDPSAYDTGLKTIAREEPVEMNQQEAEPSDIFTRTPSKKIAAPRASPQDTRPVKNRDITHNRNAYQPYSPRDAGPVKFKLSADNRTIYEPSSSHDVSRSSMARETPAGMHREEGNTAEVHNRKLERNTQSSCTPKANTATLPRRDSDPVAYSLSADNQTLSAQSDVVVTRSLRETKALGKNHGKIVVFARGQETDEVAIARHMQNLDASQERARYFVMRFRDPGMTGSKARNAKSRERNEKKKALSEGKIIVFAREEESDETAIERYNREKEHVNLRVGSQSDPSRPDTPSRIAQQGRQNDRNLRSSPPHPPNAQHLHGVRAERIKTQSRKNYRLCNKTRNR